MDNEDTRNTVEESPIEKEIYRSCLKELVEFLNTTLPPLSDEESESEEKQPQKKKKIIQKEKKPTESSYLLKDVVPTRVPKEIKENNQKKTKSGKGKSRNTKNNKTKEYKKPRK